MFLRTLGRIYLVTVILPFLHRYVTPTAIAIVRSAVDRKLEEMTPEEKARVAKYRNHAIQPE